MTSGESLINATIYDLTDGIGTTTNEYGFFSLTLPEGEHQLRFSYVGYADKVEKLNLSKDMHHNMALRVDGKLPEVVVDGDLNSPLLTTQTGKRSFSNKDIKTEFAPDVFTGCGEDSAACEWCGRRTGVGKRTLCAWRQWR